MNFFFCKKRKLFHLEECQNPDQKMWNASRFCVSSLRRGHANLLCIVPILVYVLPKQVHYVPPKRAVPIGINLQSVEVQDSVHRQSSNSQKQNRAHTSQLQCIGRLSQWTILGKIRITLNWRPLNTEIFSKRRKIYSICLEDLRWWL